VVIGVGSKPESFSEMIEADLVRPHNTPSSIIPHVGKVIEDDIESSGSEEGAILDEDKLGIDFFDNSRHFSPQP
jgi:hypothetical protein